MNSKNLFLAMMMLNFAGQNALASDSARTFHCSLLVNGNAFGQSPTRQLGFDVNEGETIALLF